jgi:16S rRNA (guanine966-N2)-methyltransferase
MTGKARGVRVIAGANRGRRLVVPAGDRVRPTKDIVREALFSALDARGAIHDANVLDLYAGTGALAIEALSRGAARATLVERDRDALGAIKANLRMLGYDDRARVVALDAARFVDAPPPADAPFDVAFVDPPYTAADDDVSALLGRLLGAGWLADDAIVSVERPARHPVVAPPGCTTQWQRAFGDTLLTLCWKSPTGPVEEETRLS